MAARVAILCALAFGLTCSCGYIRAGEWNDDPGNWKRAFGRESPKGWNVVHSRYIRYPHFTYEAGYYFEVRLSAEAAATVIHPDYFRIGPHQGFEEDPCTERPHWFAPGPPETYDVWGAPKTFNFRLVIDKRDHVVFVSDCQL